MRILVGVCGGIAAYKAAELVRRLRERGHETRCALTAGGAAFLQPLTLEVLSGHPVYGDDYLQARPAGVDTTPGEAHIEAARWAEVVVVAPATAHTLAKLALGLGDDFLTTTALAFDGPLLLAPAMHPVMWNRETTRDHVAALRRRGAVVVGPVEGPLASGETGVGRMAEPSEIVAALAATTPSANGSLRGRTVVVTAGPTHEPVDAVRVLANRSSGRMGFELAAAAQQRGARVVLIAGPVALSTPPGVERRDVVTAAEMRTALYAAAPDADLVLMTAAVADFRPRRSVDGKLKRAEMAPGFALELEPNPDLLAGLPAIAPRAVIVGFAAETREVERGATEKLRAKGCDFVVANDVSRTDIGFAADANEVTVLSRSAAPVFLSRRPKSALAGDLLDIFVPATLARAQSSAVVGR